MVSAAEIDRGLPTDVRDALARRLVWALADRRRLVALAAAAQRARLLARGATSEPASTAETRAAAWLRAVGLLAEPERGSRVGSEAIEVTDAAQPRGGEGSRHAGPGRRVAERAGKRARGGRSAATAGLDGEAWGEEPARRGASSNRRPQVDSPWAALATARLERYAEVARMVRPGRSVAARLHQTRSLLAAELYFEVHELLEPLWRRSRGVERDVLQGLIQAAVAWYHWQRGNTGGAARLARAAASRLAPRRGGWRGFDVETVARAARGWAEWLARDEQTSPPPARPFLTP